MGDLFTGVSNFCADTAAEVADFLSVLADNNVTGLDPQTVASTVAVVNSLVSLQKENELKAAFISQVQAQIKRKDFQSAKDVELAFKNLEDGNLALWSIDKVIDTPSCRRAQQAEATLVGSTGSGEDELVFSQTQATKCPLTTKTFEDPIQSKHCGHTYERRAVEQILAKKKQFTCPVAGCRAKSKVIKSIADFRSDKRMRKQLNLDA